MKQFMRYLTVGVLNTILGYCIIFTCMYLMKLSPELSNVIGYGFGLLTSYVLNRKYTFNSTQKHRDEIIRFLAVFIIAYAMNYVVLVVLIYQFSVHEGLSQLLAGLIYVLSAYFMNKFYVFKSPKINEQS